jgi:hypothetical protein
MLLKCTVPYYFRKYGIVHCTATKKGFLRKPFLVVGCEVKGEGGSPGRYDLGKQHRHPAGASQHSEPISWLHMLSAMGVAAAALNQDEAAAAAAAACGATGY